MPSPRPVPRPPQARHDLPTRTTTTADPHADTSSRRERRDPGAASTYRSFLHAPAGRPLLDVVDRELEYWLEGKQPSAWEQLRVNSAPMDLMQVTGAKARGYQHRVVQYLRGQIRGGQALRLTMVERGRRDEETTWTTEVTAFEPSDAGIEGWVAIEISNDRGEFCATPRLVKDLLKTITLRDGISPMLGQIRGLDSTEQLLQLKEALVDPQRRYPIVVVGTGAHGDLDLALFRRQVEKWTEGISGQGHVVMLTEHATAMFNQVLPERLRTPAWTLHTYLPGLDPENPEEWSRHRLLSTRSLASRPDGQIRGILTNTARTAAHASTFPTAVDETTALLKRRMRNDTIAARRSHATTSMESIDRAPAAPASQPQAAAITSVDPLAAVLERQVLRALGLDALTGAAIAHVVERLSAPEADIDLLTAYIEEQDRELDQARTTVAEATSRQQEAEDLADELQSLNTDLEGTNSILRDQNRYLQTELAKTTNAAAAYALPTAPDEIDDFFEIMDRIQGLTHVQFTGDDEVVLQLSVGDRNGSEARNAWRALISLDSYARHHIAGEVKTFKEYTEGAGPADCRIAAGKCVPTESEQTINQFGSSRMFPVPTDVASTGEVMMLAHIRLGQSDTRAPRLHYYDDVDRTGKIYVGYIGPHLPNTKTSRS